MTGILCAGFGKVRRLAAIAQGAAFFVSFLQVVFPAALHRFDQAAAHPDHEDSAEGGQDRDEHRESDRERDANLVEAAMTPRPRMKMLARLASSRP